MRTTRENSQRSRATRAIDEPNLRKRRTSAEVETSVFTPISLWWVFDIIVGKTDISTVMPKTHEVNNHPKLLQRIRTHAPAGKEGREESVGEPRQPCLPDFAKVPWLERLAFALLIQDALGGADPGRGGGLFQGVEHVPAIRAHRVGIPLALGLAAAGRSASTRCASR